MSAIFWHDEAQQRLALETKAEQERCYGQEVFTELAPVGEFYLAEDYHQKYMLRRTGDLLAELRAWYPLDDDLVRSTAAARINGYVAGCGELEDLEAEADSYGISPAGTASC